MWRSAYHNVDFNRHEGVQDESEKKAAALPLLEASSSILGSQVAVATPEGREGARSPGGKRSGLRCISGS